MKKSKINFIIGIAMFVLITIIAGLGLLIKYVLLSGSQRWIIYKRNVDLRFLGLDRHQWGTIHFLIAILLIVLLILHIILHWKAIVCLYKRFIKKKNTRIMIGYGFIIISLLLVIFPFIIKVEVEEIASGKERFNTDKILENSFSKEQNIEKKETEGFKKARQENDKYNSHGKHKIDFDIEVKGYMTIIEVSERYNIPCAYIKSKLHLSESISDNEKLGHLRKKYGFKMSEIEEIVYDYKKLKNQNKGN